MALRTYSDGDGGEWRVWRVVPDKISFATLVESYRDCWLCFERVGGRERRRLSMTKVPPAWESLSDEQLDTLRCVAEPATQRSIAIRAEGVVDTGAIETAQRDARPSGPRRASDGEERRS
jgi:hypothetical protein